MAYLQRKLKQRIYEEESKIVNSLTSKDAYSQSRGIYPTEIYGYNNTFLKGIIESFIRGEVIKTDGHVCWIDYSKYEVHINRRKATNVMIAAFVIIFAIVTLVITWILR
ncbi:MAG: hypothetical protein AB1Z23_02235 [Eubacteriales bacterium]